MNKTVVKCTNCGKELFLTNTPETNRGKIAHEVQQKGFIAKLPALFGHCRFEYFCCKECKNKWFERFSEDTKNKANKIHRQLSEVMRSKDFQDGLREGLSRISLIFNKLKKL